MPEYVNRDNRIRVVTSDEHGVEVVFLAGSICDTPGQRWRITHQALVEYWTEAPSGVLIPRGDDP